MYGDFKVLTKQLNNESQKCAKLQVELDYSREKIELLEKKNSKMLEQREKEFNHVLQNKNQQNSQTEIGTRQKFKKINNLNLKSFDLEGLVIKALRTKQNQGSLSK